MTAQDRPADGFVICWTCGERHPAEWSHKSPFGGHDVWSVVCTQDGLVDYYTAPAVILP